MVERGAEGVLLAPSERGIVGANPSLEQVLGYTTKTSRGNRARRG
jgi:hypothetical protein